MIPGPLLCIPLIPKMGKPLIQDDLNSSGSLRLNKFVRRLHDMLQAEKGSGVVEWRRGLLVLYSTDVFAKKILPKYFNTKNFKTFRRQLNYYGFVHVRSFSTTGSSTTALWVNQDLAKEGADDISSVLKLKRVEPCETAKTAEGRRCRKELAIHTVEEGIGINAKSLQLEQIRSMALRGEDVLLGQTVLPPLNIEGPPIPREVHIPTDSSTASYSGTDSRDSTTAMFEDIESTNAANVLLMLSKPN